MHYQRLPFFLHPRRKLAARRSGAPRGCPTRCSRIKPLNSVDPTIGDTPSRANSEMSGPSREVIAALSIRRITGYTTGMFNQPHLKTLAAVRRADKTGADSPLGWLLLGRALADSSRREPTFSNDVAACGEYLKFRDAPQWAVAMLWSLWKVDWTIRHAFAAHPNVPHAVKSALDLEADQLARAQAVARSGEANGDWIARRIDPFVLHVPHDRENWRSRILGLREWWFAYFADRGGLT